MEKPLPYIHTESHPDFEWGILVIGPVAIPIWIPSAAYITALVGTLLWGIVTWFIDPSSQWAPFVPFAWVAGPSVAIILLLIVAAIVWTIVDDILRANGRRRGSEE